MHRRDKDNHHIRQDCTTVNAPAPNPNDRHDARNQLHALCFVLEKPSRVRLLAARSGAIALEAQDMPAPWGDPARCIILPLPVDPVHLVEPLVAIHERFRRRPELD